MTTTFRRLAVAALLLPLLAAACSSTSEEVTDKIAAQAQEQLKLDEPPEVSCPDDAKAEKGETFTCTMVLEKIKVPIDVTFTDDTTFEFTARGAVFQKKAIDGRLAEQLANSDIAVESVACPGRALVVVREGKTVACDATLEDGTEAVLTVGLNEDGEAQIQDIQPKA